MSRVLTYIKLRKVLNRKPSGEGEGEGEKREGEGELRVRHWV